MTWAIKHFTLTEAQAMALIRLVNVLGPHGLKNRVLDGAADQLDEQLAQQNAPWERCATCRGSGWVEGA